ncbi:MAG: DNA-directed RNA polymerase subunit beta' [Victivallales bacterium]|nr:DNA-directed RNA polymerase subunit beta' [Victivallales bacterium]
MDSTNKHDIFDNETLSDANCVTIGVASPEVMRSWSRGEVKNPETINYRTFKPEKGGLFCEKIFGPVRDWECSCGKYKRVKHKGVVCDRCGVEVTQARVRRERMGHLELAVPVSHVWFFKCLPSRIGLMLDIQPKTLDRVLYYERWIVTDKGNTPLQEKQLLDEEQYDEAREQYGDDFQAQMGAEAIETLLGKLDLPTLQVELTEEMKVTNSKATRKKLSKRVRLIEGFLKNKMDPRWMILHVLPVLPPDLRPLVPLEGGRFATSDLNDLYRRVINRNNRLRSLLSLNTPNVIIQNEKRMLQEAVDALLDNGRHGRPVTGTGNRNLKSLTDMLKGKQGRFRQNLLGKRVDYSGRSVIVVGPELRINQCGLPKEMALVLFEPFIMEKLKLRGMVSTVRNAKKWIEQRRKEVWDILDEVTKGHPVLLNRAPTLHRLSIQAFDPILIEGQAIRLHPLVCTAFNADFDGDQMAVHVPLSNEAQLEAKLLMLSPNNIFSPASGKPITIPGHDISLGAYYLTYEDKKKHAEFNAIMDAYRNAKDRDPDLPNPLVFNDTAEVLRALEAKQITMHTFFNLRNPFYGKDTVWGSEHKNDKFIQTTAGRCLFTEIWPEKMGFVNTRVGKKELGAMIKECFENVGREGLIKLLDKLKDIGYEYATWAGFSIGIQDMIVPPEKKNIIEAAQEKIDVIERQQREGSITRQERYNRSVDVWTQANTDLAGILVKTLEENDGRDEINPIFAMLDSGSRGSKDQIRQLAGMRGLMAKPSGEIIVNPIRANFREGLTVLEYFISSHGARKGLADTALKTADSGYMTRRLVDVAHDVICTQEDCGTVNGIWFNVTTDGDKKDFATLAERITGRFSVDDIKDPKTGETIVGVNEEITIDKAKRITAAGIERVHIRSVLTCESRHGVCQKCYGRNLATGDLPLLGDPLGIIAAQSIGEPGTQLTMRTFHVGGTASAEAKKNYYEAKHSGRLKLTATPIKQIEGTYVVMGTNVQARIVDEDEQELESYDLKQGSILTKTIDDIVEVGDRFVTWDPYNIPTLATISGKVQYHGLIEGITYQVERSQSSGNEEKIVMEIHQEDVHPSIKIIPDDVSRKMDKQLNITSSNETAIVTLSPNAHIIVEDGQYVHAGDILAKSPRQTTTTKDITGGLPRVAELFEARRPKRAAEIARLDGSISIGHGQTRGGTSIFITDLESNTKVEHHIPSGKSIIVHEGDLIHKGEKLTDGDIVLHDMLEVCGPQEMQGYLVNQVQEVYRSQGVEINDKHIEIIVRQMMHRVRITEPGTSRFLYGESIDRHEFEEENERVSKEGGVLAEAKPMLQGITKAALSTDSFISAASFQDTTRVLTEAATHGKVDYLRGFKENVIMGHLIPAGTGYHTVQNVKLTYVADEAAKEEALPEEDVKEKKTEEEMKKMTDFFQL